MIAGRMLEAFSARCVKDVSTVTAICEGVKFILKGEIIKEEGWRAVLKNSRKKDKEQQEAEERESSPASGTTHGNGGGNGGVAGLYGLRGFEVYPLSCKHDGGHRPMEQVGVGAISLGDGTASHHSG